VSAGGLGAFSALDLTKSWPARPSLSGPRSASLTRACRNRISAGRGNPFPDDLPHVYGAAARSRRFRVMKAQLKAFLENRTKSPESVFSDTLSTTMQRDQPRFRPMTVDEIPKMDLEKSFAFYRDRFADASDFTFVFVGNLDLEAIKLLVCRYLASLPSCAARRPGRTGACRRPKGREADRGDGRRIQKPDGCGVLRPFSYTLENRNAIGPRARCSKPG